MGGVSNPASARDGVLPVSPHACGFASASAPGGELQGLGLSRPHYPSLVQKVGHLHCLAW